MGKIVSIFIILSIIFSGIAFGQTQQPNSSLIINGIDISKLSPEDQATFLSLRDKAIKGPQASHQGLTDTIKDITKGVNPTSLTEWRKFITDTIKDICNDLNITVNEFIKTPAGAGISFLIIYHVAGKEILFTLIDKIYGVVFVIPFWFVICGILYYLMNKFLGTMTVYERETESVDEKGNKIFKREYPKRVHKYHWKTSEPRMFLSVVLFIIFIITTIFSLVIIF